MTLSLKDYQEWTKTTAIYPDAGKKNTQELMYCAIGLSSETGELANFVKKIYRDGDSPELRDLVQKELGDIIWYAARMADALGVELQDMIELNHAKIVSRQQRGVLAGSGDNR